MNAIRNSNSKPAQVSFPPESPEEMDLFENVFNINSSGEKCGGVGTEPSDCRICWPDFQFLEELWGLKN